MRYRVTAYPRLRIRSGAGLNHNVIGHLPYGSVIHVQDFRNGWALLSSKINHEGKWIEGFVSSQYLAPLDELNVGVNIDPRNPVSDVPISTLRPLHYVRFAYDSRQQDVESQFNFYDRILNDCAVSGITPVIVLNHQTWGEGRGFNWDQMHNDINAWRSFSARWLHAISKIVERYSQRSIVWQIWNEGDSASEAAVGIPAEGYAYMLDIALMRIRQLNPQSVVISQGHVSGRSDYWKTVIHHSNSANLLNGLALHPYGISGKHNGAFGVHGNLPDLVNGWRRITSLPIWFTEFGLCGGNAPMLPESTVAQYAAEFLNACAELGVKTAIWYGYATGMHSCRGALHHGMRGDLWNVLKEYAQNRASV